MKKLLVVVLVIALVAVLAIGLVACGNKKGGEEVTIRVAAPEGTPALAICHMVTENKKLDGLNIEYSVVAPANIATEMAAEKADIVIMPINAGANLIANKNAPYKLVSIAVDGSLYLIGNKDGSNSITLDDIKGKTVACIGQGAVPGLTFSYILSANNISVVTEGTPSANQVKIVWAADGPAANAAVQGGSADYAVVGEPAATALSAKAGYNARMDIQALYNAAVGNNNSYPQAGLFVKASLNNNGTFMAALFNALAESKNWVLNNKDAVTAYAKEHLYESAAFPAGSIERCAINCERLNYESQDKIVSFLSRIMPNVNWTEKKDILF